MKIEFDVVEESGGTGSILLFSDDERLDGAIKIRLADTWKATSYLRAALSREKLQEQVRKLSEDNQKESEEKVSDFEKNLGNACDLMLDYARSFGVELLELLKEER